MSIDNMLDEIKRHPDFEKVGMILCHNGVVRATTRNGRRVKGLRVAVNHEKLEQIVMEQSQKPGIVDIRENVISVLTQTLDAIKKKVTQKTEYFMD